MRIALEELTSRYRAITAVAPPVYEANVFVKAVERFDVTFTPAP